MDTTEQFVKAGEMGDILGGVKAQQIRQWARQGRIPAVVLPSGRLIFDPKEVVAAIRSDAELKKGEHG